MSQKQVQNAGLIIASSRETAQSAGMTKGAAKDIPSRWWAEEYGFFGRFYLEGDDSMEGYLQSSPQTLLQRTTAEVGGVITILGLKGGERILDIPCGYGRHSVGLAERGLSVVGSDLNAAFLDVAETRARRAGVHVPFVKENMLEIHYDCEYDAVINMFYSFGFFESDSHNLAVLERFYRALKPGGAFLMHTDVNMPRVLDGTYVNDETRHLSSGRRLRIIDTYDPHTKRMDGAWILIDANETIKRYSVRVYSREEFVGMCQVVGFRSVTSYGNWEGAAYSERSEDMIVVAQK